LHDLTREWRELAAEVGRDANVPAPSTLSLHGELRMACYAGVLLIVGGIGLLVQQHFDRIGPSALFIGLLVTAAACCLYPLRLHLAARERGVAGDYLLLLGALLTSIAVGYGETQFDWLGRYWNGHLLWLTALHAAVAYWLNSRLVLAVALTTLAAWFGVQSSSLSPLGWLERDFAWSTRMLSAAVAVLAWWQLNRASTRRQFDAVLEHGCFNLAAFGALAWCAGREYYGLGLLLLLGVAGIAIVRSIRGRDELLAASAVVYGAIGLSIVLARVSQDVMSAAILILFVITGASGLLWWTRRYLREDTE
jgi:hypothetical protein